MHHDHLITYETFPLHVFVKDAPFVELDAFMIEMFGRGVRSDEIPNAPDSARYACYSKSYFFKSEEDVALVALWYPEMILIDTRDKD